MVSASYAQLVARTSSLLFHLPRGSEGHHHGRQGRRHAGRARPERARGRVAQCAPAETRGHERGGAVAPGRGTVQYRFACAPGSKNAIVLTSSGDQFDRIPLASIHQRYAILSSQAHRPHSPFSICPPSTHPSPYLGSVRLRQYSTANVSRPWPCSCRALLAVLIGSPRAASAHDSHSTLHSSQDTMNASLAAIHLVPIVANRGANALPTLRTAAQCRMLPNPCACHLHRSVGTE